MYSVTPFTDVALAGKQESGSMRYVNTADTSLPSKVLNYS
jgi:hypothetical protein